MKNWKILNNAVVGVDIPAVVVVGLVVVWWPTLWVGTRTAAVRRFGSIYG